MKHRSYLCVLALLMCLASAVSGSICRRAEWYAAQSAPAAAGGRGGAIDVSTHVDASTREGLDETDTLDPVPPHVFFVFHEERGYDDHIMVRWMPDEYFSFRCGATYGYEVLRSTVSGDVDTTIVLAECVMPLTVEEFEAKYGAADTIAAAAAQSIYGRSVGLNQTEKAPGTPGSIMEVYEQQQDLFGFGALVADMRPDLALDMGLGFADRTAKAGAVYSYHVRCLAPDSVMRGGFIAGREVSLGEYQPVALETPLSDSIEAPAIVTLLWKPAGCTTYIIERRKVGETEWTRLNDRDYLPMMNADVDHQDFRYVDRTASPGTYDYRLRGRDLFGDITAPTPPHRVVIPDLVGPIPPELTHIEILRGDTTIMAELTFVKDSIEDDFIGYIPFYNNPKVMGDSWIPLVPAILPPDATTARVDVTGLETGLVSIAAIDTARNVTYSLPRNIRIADLKAPSRPENLRYTTEIGTPEELEERGGRGLVRLEWDELPDRDIDYFQVAFANDTTHMFLGTSFDGKMRDCQFVDTLALDVNQKYIYYKVRAIDFSTNEGEWSDIIQVERPSLVVPSAPHLERATQDERAIRQTWVVGAEVQIARHYVYRRSEGEKEWTLLAVCDADSVMARDYRISFDDRPRASKNRWEYALESVTGTGLTSGKSLIYSVKFNAYRNIPCPVQLDGDCLGGPRNETRLIWDVKGELPNCDEWYYCVYRKGPGDKDFKFILSVSKDQTTYSDFLLRPGEEAQYYVKVRMPGIGTSDPSNVITVRAKEKK